MRSSWTWRRSCSSSGSTTLSWCQLTTSTSRNRTRCARSPMRATCTPSTSPSGCPILCTSPSPITCTSIIKHSMASTGSPRDWGHSRSISNVWESTITMWPRSGIVPTLPTLSPSTGQNPSKTWSEISSIWSRPIPIISPCRNRSPRLHSFCIEIMIELALGRLRKN